MTATLPRPQCSGSQLPSLLITLPGGLLNAEEVLWGWGSDDCWQGGLVSSAIMHLCQAHLQRFDLQPMLLGPKQAGYEHRHGRASHISRCSGAAEAQEPAQILVCQGPASTPAADHGPVQSHSSPLLSNQGQRAARMSLHTAACRLQKVLHLPQTARSCRQPRSRGGKPAGAAVRDAEDASTRPERGSQSRADDAGAGEAGEADNAAGQLPEQQGKKRKGLLRKLRRGRKRGVGHEAGQEHQQQQPEEADNRKLLRELRGLAGSLKRSFTTKRQRWAGTDFSSSDLLSCPACSGNVRSCQANRPHALLFLEGRCWL